MTFRTIHTLVGLAAIAEAEATSEPINLTHMAVGDGNGNDVEPSESQTELVRERFRTTVNRVYQDPDEPRKFTAEMVIPAEEGGWVMREVGIIDSDGDLFAVGNLPSTYKPAGDDTAFSDCVIRMEFYVANADIITLMVDPNVAIATHSWVLNNVAMLPPGGATGQVLTKLSNADSDAAWQDLDGVSVVVNTIEETQTLAASQTIVDLVTCTTTGLAVYIDGVRLRADQWTADGLTSFVLDTDYPAGTKLTAVQNEPAGSLPDPLVKSQNLADVPDKALGRANLGVYSKAEVDQKAPASLVGYFARSSAPTGWLKANGAAISRTAYATLFAAIGTTYGAGDGATTFNLPDLRAEFVRGLDDGRGVDAGREIGSAQAAAFQSHNHTGTAASSGAHSHSASSHSAGDHGHTASSGAAGSHAHGGSTDSSGTHTHGFQIYEPDDSMGSYAAADGGGDSNVTYNTASSGAHTHALTTDTEPAHTHTVSVSNAGSHSHTITVASVDAHTHSLTIGSTGGNETRPRNIALLACIKF